MSLIETVNVQDFGINLEEFNPLLSDYIKSNIDNKVVPESGEVSSAASITRMDLHADDNEYVRKILDIVLWITPRVACNIASNSHMPGSFLEAISPELIAQVAQNSGWHPRAFELTACWGILYDGAQGVISHNHFPFTLSFSYYSHTSEESAPLEIENKTIPAKEGNLTLFSSHEQHEVKGEENSGERIALVGNLIYNPGLLL